MSFELITFLLVTLVSFFTVINPLSTAIIFLNLTTEYSKKEKREIAREACLSALMIMLFFAFTGLILFEFFGITVGSFKIMGGLFLFGTAWGMLKGEGKQLHPDHLKNDITLVPLAIPLISGPATIVTTVVLFSEADGLLSKGLVILAIALVILTTFFILTKSHWVKKVLREKGIRVLNKLMGIILGSLAIQFVVNGIRDVLPFILGSL